MKRHTKGIILFFLCVITFGIDPLLGKPISHYDPFLLTFITAFIGSVLLFPFVFPQRRELKKLNRDHWFLLILIGVLSQVVAFFLFFKGLQFGTATEASFLNGASALFALAVAHYWLHERITKLQYVGAAIMFFGLYVFTTLFSLEISSASIYFIAAAFFWGSMQVVAKRLSHNVSMLMIAFSRMFIGTMFLLPFVYGSLGDLLTASFIDLVFMFFFGFVFAVSLVAFYSAIRYLKASEASFVVLLAPFVTAVLGYFFLGEILVPLQWFGGVLMFLGLYLILPKNNHSSSSSSL